ncbi:MAG: MarR family transcriptional regulator [Alphaproteobacteria bacterium]
MRLTAHEALEIWRRMLREAVRRDAPDLTARQLAVLLDVYLGQPPHTVRGLASELEIAKPAVTRALDRLCALDLVRRKTDPEDRRSILVQRTVKGSVFLSEFAEAVLRGVE